MVTGLSIAPALVEEALAARQPSKQPDSVALGEATEFCTEKGDRQPVGQEPIGFQFRSRQWSDEEFAGPWLNPNVPNRAHYDSRPANYETRSIYAAPPAQAVDLGLQLDRYDAGLLGDGGGGDVGWWQDYIRAELDRAHEFYQDQADAHG
ncbi:hypothetical protein D7V18_13970 [Stenotrophomonas maltophilia]|nr:hypothetical protein [Stenotrophomonas maltophilia]